MGSKEGSKGRVQYDYPAEVKVWLRQITKGPVTMTSKAGAYHVTLQDFARGLGFSKI